QRDHGSIQAEEKRGEEEFHGIKTEPEKANSRSFVTNQSVKELVSRLLEESSLDIPLSWKPGNRPRTGRGQSGPVPEYDELGFYQHSETGPRCYDVVLDP